MFDVITIGSATYDVFIRSASLEANELKTETCLPIGAKIDIDELEFSTGGGATNAAATLSRLGFNTATICSVGRDVQGQEIVSTLRADDISIKFIQQTEDDLTGYSVIILAGSGERTILVHRGAASKIDINKIPWPKLKAKWFYVTSLGGDLDLLERILDQAEAVGAKISFNPGNTELKFGFAKLEPLLRRIDILNLNREEAAELAGLDQTDLSGIMAKLRNLPKMTLLMTDGLGGAYATENADNWHCEIVDVPRINTTGAGDAFGSGFVAGLMKLNGIQPALAVGMLNAAGLVQQTGAKSGLLEKFPTKNEITQVVIRPWS
ncbi:hypothetical protein A2480_02165 [Candidatus Uhrbacteria bacterium RIFOXYC2_FULL_47_19]|uniref:Carbohydrate kinase PfkB domain-containing protein n=1 Tax=Candidatus Uhrbacteria bacterium RIFOXYC2_FULL_47_19 TaxID=1802424 RepID=A0A1F7WEV2_9BACT|nr:MAG: hypothetical protein A2480_02165 [Candidatus Uhrbacteria bacterium RIFOXYC2_FULL_47_19]HCC21860.1 hypothetical protein [Candidatus Uhrbacteria bacterium]